MHKAISYASQNRRVDIYMYASEQMIKNAEAGK